MKKLLVITGPTASGKTALAIQLARQHGTEIVSCDSRQFYRELDIGVARPSAEELAAAKHHFIACRSVTEPYNISEYEHDALAVIRCLFESHDEVIAVGGSGLYIDALRQGVTAMPDPTPELRQQLQQMPLEEKRAQLKLLDPDYYSRVDLCNPVRLQRALEVCYMTGKPYSQVIANQILDEVQSLLPYRHLSTLRTVGYRELFPVLDGTKKLEDAVSEIKLNTWHYARKQLTWCRRYI